MTTVIGDTSWLPVDLTALLAEDYKPLLPTIGKRDDGVGLLYPARIHTLTSAPEAGKTWLALHLCVQEMEQGHGVVYIDFEDDAEGILGRLRALGASTEMIQEKFRYIRPQIGLADAESAGLRDVITTIGASLVVIDGVTEALVTQDLNLLDNQEVAQFFRVVVTPLADLGPAVLLLDHEVKKVQDRGNYGLGAQHKLAAVTGAAFKLSNTRPFAVGSTGSSQLSVVKDRPGQIRRRTLDGNTKGHYGDLVVDSAGSDIVTVAVRSKEREVVMDQALELMKRRVLAAMGEGRFVTLGQIKGMVRGNSQRAGWAVRELIKDGVISASPPYEVIQKPSGST